MPSRLVQKKIVQLLKENPVSSLFTKYGTAAMVDICQALKVLPTKNFRHGVLEGAEKINAQAMYDIIKERGGEGQTQHACMHPCAIQCSNVYPDKDGTLLCSPMGADHTFGFTLRDEDVPTSKEGKVGLSKKFQVIGSRMDAMGMCNFVRYSVREDMTPLLDLIKFRYGVDISAVEFDDIVKETLKIEHQFNTDAGITAQDYRFAETFYEEAQPETAEVMDITDEESRQARQW